MGDDFFYGCWEGFSVKGISRLHEEPAPEMDGIRVHRGNINVYELWPVLVRLKRWGNSYKNKKINIVTDNMQVLAMLAAGDPTTH